MSEIESWFVIAMGLGTVFVGLICIIALCKILGAVCRVGQQNDSIHQGLATPESKPSPAPSKFANRQEVIAAIGAAIAEESGVDVNAIRIVSIKKI